MPNWWRSNADHVLRYGHVPEWVKFDNIAICEKCIKPPSRPPLIRALGFDNRRLVRVE